MSSTVVGLFDTRDGANNAIKDLKANGFFDVQISVVTNDWNGDFSKMASDPIDAEAPPHVGLLGYLADNGGVHHIGSNVVVSGPIAEQLSGGPNSHAAGPLGALVSLGVPSQAAQYYAEAVRRGDSLVAVSAIDVDADRAQTILDRDGAIDIDIRSEFYRTQGFTIYDPSTPVFTHEQAVADRGRYEVYHAEAVQTRPVVRVRRYVGPYADYQVITKVGDRYVVPPLSTIEDDIARVASQDPTVRLI